MDDSLPERRRRRRRNVALPAAEIRCDAANRSVTSSVFADGYFSDDDPLGEAKHVFLRGNDLPEAWSSYAAVRDGERAFVIGELGFGTGLNFLATWHLWRDAGPPPPARLAYVSVEGYPLMRAQLEAAHATTKLTTTPELAPLAQRLRAAWWPPLPGMQRLLFDEGRVSLTLLHDEALRMLAAWEPSHGVDAWYLDGFAPARNPQMWRPALFAQLKRLSRGSGATLATYTVAGEVRRGLQAAGFTVAKVPGHGRKREMLRAHAAEVAVAATDPRTAASSTGTRAVRADVAVIGAGIAGCAAAEALARRGHHVTLFERRPLSVAAGGAAVAGLLMPRLDLQYSPALRFYLAANRYAWHTLERLTAAGHEIPHGRTGALMLATTADEQQRYQRISEELHFPPEVLAWRNPQQAAEVARVPLSGQPALHVAEAGWVEPGALCRALLTANPTVVMRDGVCVAALERDKPARTWLLRGPDGALLGEASHVVLANATAARRFAQAEWMPLRPLRGQTTALAPTPLSASLACPLVFGGYLTPAVAGHHHVGATYVPLDEDHPAAGGEYTGDDVDLVPAEHRRNLERAAATLPELFGDTVTRTLTEQALAKWPGRAGVRATTPDHLPLVGAVARRDAFVEAFAALRHGPLREAPPAVPVYPGLFALVGLGSRGLAAAPLAAELLAAQMQSEANEPWPLERDLAEALAPHRFLERALRRRQL